MGWVRVLMYSLTASSARKKAMKRLFTNRSDMYKIRAVVGMW